MEIFLVKTQSGVLAPFDDADAQRMAKIKTNEVVRAEITKPRNLLFHKKFMALVRLVFENQERYNSIEDLLVEFKLKVGHYKEHITTDGKIVYVPKSISFSQMDEYEFNEFYNKALNVLGKIIKVDSETLREQIEQFYY
ncbi:MAG TPA: DUF1367 family protein [Candidatus Marinimicrobia bacterium]|jgi:hypothetical protein|nr:DUF1367 family protein [Candidatus Neomarinimicrobiota bacterium]